jgi:hypothetical protein
VLGNDVSGTVEVSHAEDFAEGDDVFGITASGGYAEYAVSPAVVIAKKPAGVSDEQAAAIPAADSPRGRSSRNREFERVKDVVPLRLLRAHGRDDGVASRCASARANSRALICARARQVRRAASQTSDASSVISGTPASARLTMQPSLAPFAAVLKAASSIPGTRPTVVRAIAVIVGAPSTTRRVTTAFVFTDSTGVPASARAAESAIEKQAA